MFDDLTELYQEIILDHGKNPRNKRPIEGSTHQAYGNNPMCGDKLALYLRINGEGVIEDVGFQGEGCAISEASASLLTEVLVNRTQDQAMELFRAFHRLATGDPPEDLSVDIREDFQRLEILGGVRAFPMRVKCATLAWHTLDSALHRKATATTEVSQGRDV